MGDRRSKGKEKLGTVVPVSHHAPE
uniref:Uncharacterized protein n=1 Tax=Anguilla anguilla TaxID=7936 RepID=A0A0E9T005_ANGAN